MFLSTLMHRSGWLDNFINVQLLLEGEKIVSERTLHVLILPCQVMHPFTMRSVFQNRTEFTELKSKPSKKNTDELRMNLLDSSYEIL